VRPSAFAAFRLTTSTNLVGCWIGRSAGLAPRRILSTNQAGSGEPDLLSFAAIKDEPPAEIAAAGHDRCIIPIRPENVDAWLNPDPRDLKAQYAILDDRGRPYYGHRLAA
jgi:putative SOS response-associated peptidase YedK